MIWTTIINWICDIFDNMVSYVPSMSIELPAGSFDGLQTLVKNIGYVLPINDLLKVFDLWVAYISFRIGVAFYKHRIKVRV